MASSSQEILITPAYQVHTGVVLPSTAIVSPTNPLAIAAINNNNNANTNVATERVSDVKKKEAISFLKFYFHVNPTLRTNSTIRRATLLALYTNKLPLDSRYKKPNDMANLCGVTYGYIHSSLDDLTIREFIKTIDAERQNFRMKEPKKRKRKRSVTTIPTDTTLDLNGIPPPPPPQPQEMNQHDVFMSFLKASSTIPFLELTPVDQLDPTSEWAQMHPDYEYTMDDIARWEIEMKEQKIHTKLLDETLAAPFIPIQRPNDRRIDIPVSIFESPDAFVIYAFVPYHKPNAMKVTVNQMDVMLEGVISLPNSAILASGEEVCFPDGLVCTKAEIPEGTFCKQVKLPAPVTSSVVGKRDGVIVIHARKEESQPTVHQL